MYKKEKNKIKNGFDALAPDLFKKICENEASRIVSEAELFGELDNNTKPGHSRLTFSIAFGGVVAAFACLFLIFHFMADNSGLTDNKIMIDVNPSIKICLNEDNQVTSIEAANSDAKNIILGIEGIESIRLLMPKLIYELRNQKFLTDDSPEMLITYIYENEKDIPYTQVTNAINNYIQQEKIKLTVIQQKEKPDSDIEHNAKKTGISIGKYYLIDRLSKKYDLDKKSLYNKNISDIVSEAEKNGYSVGTDEEITCYDFSAEYNDTQHITEEKNNDAERKPSDAGSEIKEKNDEEFQATDKKDKADRKDKKDKKDKKEHGNKKDDNSISSSQKTSDNKFPEVKSNKDKTQNDKKSKPAKKPAKSKEKKNNAKNKSADKTDKKTKNKKPDKPQATKKPSAKKTPAQEQAQSHKPDKETGSEDTKPSQDNANKPEKNK